MKDKITDIFFYIDEFCKEYYKVIEEFQLPEQTNTRTRNKPCKLSDSEIITILIAFHLGNFRNLKHFYTDYIQVHLKSDFPQTVSYNRFVELQQKALLPMFIFLKLMRSGTCTDISFVDSTPIRVCDNKRIFNHKVFNGIATRGKSTMGWFFGFKLHIVVSETGDI